MKSETLKVAVIGGGSSYTPELIEGFIKHYDELPVTELYLVDIETGKEKLEIVSALAKRMIEKASVPITLKTTLNRREAIEGAAFVCTQIRVGGLEARAKDERIPLRYGCVGQETTGAGGFAKALRTIPVILDICRDIEELAPEATLINFTNPAGIVTEAVLNHTNVKSIGLCNLPIDTKMQVAEQQKVDVSEVDIEMIGINHLNWTRNIRVNGKDVTKEVIKEVSETGGLTVKNIPGSDLGADFVQSLGVLPCSYLSYYYLRDAMIEDQTRSMEDGTTRAEVVMKTEKELFELYQDLELAEKPKQLEERGGAYYSDAAVNLMRSMYNNTQDIQVVNVLNKGMIPMLADDASIEINCVIGADGARPVQLLGDIPTEIIGLLQVVKNYESLTVKAVISGEYEAALHALTIHPLVSSAKIARQILDDILAENKAYIGQFKK